VLARTPLMKNSLLISEYIELEGGGDTIHLQMKGEVGGHMEERGWRTYGR
jgi:hypothetical protein